MECRVTIDPGFRIRVRNMETARGRKHRRGLDTLSREKFEHPLVKERVEEVFGSMEYRKVLVVWEVEDQAVIETARRDYGIEIWKVSDILGELEERLGTNGYRDEVLRTIQLLSGARGTGVREGLRGP